MNIEKNMLRYEKGLSKYATLSSDAKRLYKMEEDIRPAFFRDTDRIIYSLAYTRYIDKTQVFSLNSNDHISKRIVHVQFVSKIARTIARALSLNEDLTEAIALGHDIGHVPFGHVGEAILSSLSEKYDGTYFNHNVQSARQLMYLENHGEGCNICYQVLDGIICHNGEFLQGKYAPKEKTIDEFLSEMESTYTTKDANKNLVPSTLEGCVVRISDMIAYVGRDIEDAIRIGLIKREDIPSSITKVLGSTNGEIVNTITLDIINNSIGKNYIELSHDVYYALKALKDFNYINIYNKANTKEQIMEYKKMFKTVFESSLRAIDTKNRNHGIYKYFLDDMNLEYISKNNNVRMVTDYIAGMTDDFFISEYKRIIESEKNN